MKTTRLGRQHPHLILPKRLQLLRSRDISSDAERQANSRNIGLSAFWPWCFKCNKRIGNIEQVHEGDNLVAWRARCHGDDHVIELEHERQLTPATDREGNPVYVQGRKVNRLVFFGPETFYGGTDEHWNPGRK